jgi:hypothetical protein
MCSKMLGVKIMKLTEKLIDVLYLPLQAIGIIFFLIIYAIYMGFYGIILFFEWQKLKTKKYLNGDKIL